MIKNVLFVFTLLGFVAAFAGAQENGDNPAHEQEHADEEHHVDETEQHGGEHYGEEHHDEMGHHDEAEHGDASGNLSDYTEDYSFTLKAGLVDGKMVYTGVGGDIDGVRNPTLEVEPGAIVEITLTNASVLEHDLMFPELEVHSGHVSAEGDTTVFAFKADEAGDFTYYCSVPGHREAGMLGTLIVSKAG